MEQDYIDIRHAVDHVQRQMERFNESSAKVINALLNDVPENLPGYLYADVNSINIVLPYNIPMAAYVRRQLGHAWEFRYQSRYDDSVARRYKHKISGVSLYLTLSMTKEGSTCKQVQIGTKTVEQPVYEIVCN
jgi:hypothetical protein